MMDQLRGMGVAMVTPFDAQKQIDYPALERIIEHMISNGVDFIVALGTTGEYVTLSQAEKFSVLDFTVEKVAGRVPVVAGFGSSNTAVVVSVIKDYHFKGIDAILSVNPSYNKPSQEGIYQHYKAIVEVAPKPIIIYNVPSRTSSNISAETTLRLAHDFDQIIGIKEASGNLEQCMKIVEGKPDDFLLLSGDDALTLPLMSIGFDGLISVVGNAMTRTMSDLVRKANEGDFKSAQADHYQLTKMIRLLFADGNPGGIKALLHQMDLCEEHLRLPLVPVNRGVYKAIGEALEAYHTLASS